MPRRHRSATTARSARPSRHITPSSTTSFVAPRATKAAAEDLLQEAFLRLTREVDAGRTPEHVRGWLYRVASNLAISRGRRRTTAFDWMSRYGRHSLGEDVESPEAGVLARERTSAIDTVLATLPTEARTALLLSADGFSGEEIAAAIGRSHARHPDPAVADPGAGPSRARAARRRPMTTVHDEFLELAAASIDFELSADRARCAGRSPCRLHPVPTPGHGARGRPACDGAIAFVRPRARSVDQVRGRIHRSGRPARPPLRLLAVAAILVLLAAAAFTVGAEILRRERDRDLSVVPPTAPIESPLSSPGPNAAWQRVPSSMSS